MTINDRRIVEQVLHTKMMLIVVIDGVDRTKYPEAKALTDLLFRDIDDAFVGLQQPRMHKLLRRSERTLDRVTAEQRLEGKSVAKFGLAVYYLLRCLVDQGYIVVQDGTAFDEALNTILPALEEHTEEEKFDKSAQKQGRRLFQSLQREGYYPGTTWSEA